MVNNAGISIAKPITDTTVADWDLQFDIMARGSFLVSREAAKALKAQKMGGDIIYISSKNSVFAGANNVAYGATKAAQSHQVRLLAVELGEFGIRVNGIAPGPIATDALLSRIKSRNPDLNSVELLDEFLENLGKQTTLGRIATINDVVNGALFLASEQSASTNGHLLPIDGGIL